MDEDERSIGDEGFTEVPVITAPEKRPEEKHQHIFENSVGTRHLKVKDKCRHKKLGIVGGQQTGHLTVFQMSPAISRRHKPNLFYCPLAKAGSTFFTRYMLALEKPGPMISPYTISILDAGRSNLETFTSLRSQQQRENYLQNSFKFLFVRNPYSRIFSAYIDKLFSPNPYYWGTWGKAVRKYGFHSKSKSAHPCGANVSFRDFVKLVANTLHKTDMHYIPMHKMCKVCDIEWNMIGQLEAVVQDVDFLSHKINVSSEFQHRSNYAASGVADVISDATRNPFGEWFKEIASCIDPYDSGRTVWRAMQVRGIIKKGDKMPFSKTEMEEMTSEKFEKACLDAARQVSDRALLKKQKIDAMRAAYASVDRSDLLKLKAIYADDFFLFDYDSEPSYIFQNLENDSVDKNILDWTQPWL